MTERKSRFALLGKVSRKAVVQIQEPIFHLLPPFLDKLHTLTADNGKVFASLDTITAFLQLEFYFAHPFASWERSSIENLNGLVRQYLPKKSVFKIVSNQVLLFIMVRLNLPPRICLVFLSPFEVSFNLPVAFDTSFQGSNQRIKLLTSATAGFESHLAGDNKFPISNK